MTYSPSSCSIYYDIQNVAGRTISIYNLIFNIRYNKTKKDAATETDHPPSDNNLKQRRKKEAGMPSKIIMNKLRTSSTAV